MAPQIWVSLVPTWPGYEAEVQGWSARLGYEAGVRGWGTRLEYEAGVRGWGTRLGYEAGVRGWGVRLGYEAGVQGWGMEILSRVVTFYSKRTQTVFYIALASSSVLSALSGES